MQSGFPHPWRMNMIAYNKAAQPPVETLLLREATPRITYKAYRNNLYRL